MIILDTNVVSELMKVNPQDEVLTWVDGQDPHVLYVTTVTLAEIHYGLQALSVGKRRAFLYKAFEEVVLEAFEERILMFDEQAAVSYGGLMVACKSLGKPMPILDGQIAAIAHSNQSQIATRNISDFVACGIGLINPFNSYP